MREAMKLVVGLVIASLFGPGLSARSAEAPQAPSDETGAPATDSPPPPILKVTETLQDALAAAYHGNPGLQAQRARVRAIDETVPQATAGWKPTVTLTGSWGEDLTKTTVGAGATIRAESHPLQGTLTVSQPLFSGGRTFFGMRQAKANVRAAREQLKSFEQQTLLDAVTQYFNVIRDKATVEISRNNVAVLKRELEAAQDRFRVGEITRTDVAQAEARYSLSQTGLTSAEATLVASRAAYASTVGHMPGILESMPPIPPLPESEASAQLVAAHNNPELVGAREAEKAASAATSVAWGALLPTISVVGQANYSESQSFFGTSMVPIKRRDEAVLAQVRVPLFQAGAEYATIRQAKQTGSQTRLIVAQTKRDLDEQVANAWEALRSARASIVSNQGQVNANQIAYEGVRQEAEVGSRTTLDVLNAEQELLNSQVALVRSQRDEYVAAYGLLAAVGMLTAKDLALPVKIYDPKANQRSLIFKQFWPGTRTKD
jgi:TolC family type I secretion outer membrane protein